MNPPLRPGDEITCVVSDHLGRYTTQARVLRVEPSWPGNGGRPRVHYHCVPPSDTPYPDSVYLKEEGITWCRGWGDTEALLAANSLVRSAAK